MSFSPPPRRTQADRRAGTITALRLRQSAPDGSPSAPGDDVLRPHRLAVGFYDVDEATGRLIRTERFELDVAGEVTEVVEAAARRRPAVILPNDDDLAYAKLRLDDASWEAANAAMQTFGGFGFAQEYDIERKFRETRLYQVAPISTNLILAYLGEHVLGMPRSY